MTGPIIELKSVERHYVQGSRKLTILNGADFSLMRGEMVALVAPSGAGKSTLLHTAGLLERPDAGDVILDGRACGRAVRRRAHRDPPQRRRLRLSVPSPAAGVLGARKHHDAATHQGAVARRGGKRAEQLLDYMQIGKRAHHRPSELSGGEQQRVAIARAVANAPLVLLADEPTGNLDPVTASYVFEALAALVRQSGLAALIATHNHELAGRMDRRVTLSEGKVVPL